MSSIVVNMWLECHDYDPDAQSKFRQRFPTQLRADWSLMVFADQSNAALRDELNRIIFQDCKTWIESDLGAPGAFNDTETFSGSEWSPGQGGLHEWNPATPAAQVKALKNDGTMPVWTFDYAGGGQAEIRAMSIFRRIGE